MVDQVNFATSGQQTPAADAIAVTPADADFAGDYFSRAIYVGTTGNLSVRMAGELGDTDVTFTAVPAGAILPIRVKQVRSTGTTASNIVVLF